MSFGEFVPKRRFHGHKLINFLSSEHDDTLMKQCLAYEIMRQLHPSRSRSGLSLTPPIRTAKAGKGSGPRGSAMRGTSWLHHAMSRRGQFAIHPDALRVAECVEKYVGGSTDPAGHLIDALRYALDPWIRRGQTRYAAQR